MGNAALRVRSESGLVRSLGVLSVYLEFTRKAFQRELQYKIANYSGFVVNTFFFVVRAYVFMALYEHRGVVAGYNAIEAVTFAGLTQAMLMAVGIFGSAKDIGEDVRSGQVATDLMKPIDYQSYLLFRQLGRSLYYFIFRGLPIFAVMVIFFPWKNETSQFLMLLKMILKESANQMYGMLKRRK